MKFFKRFVLLAMIAFSLGTSLPKAHAVTYCTDAGGCGYQQCRTVPCLSPMIALSAIALAAIIAVALQNSRGSSDHNHSHC